MAEVGARRQNEAVPPVVEWSGSRTGGGARVAEEERAVDPLAEDRIGQESVASGSPFAMALAQVHELLP